MKRLVIWIGCCVGMSTLIAQNDSTSSQGTVTMGEVVISKDKVITLPVKNRLFQKSVIKQFAGDAIHVDFSPTKPELDWPSYKTDVLFVPDEEPFPINDYQNHIKMGYGNDQSPLLDLGLTNKFGAWKTNASLFYESFQSGPINGDNSGNSEGRLFLTGTNQVKALQIMPKLRLNFHSYHFYGNTDRLNNGFSSDDADEANWLHIAPEMNLNWSKNDTDFSLNASFENTNQSITNSEFENRETIGALDASLNHQIDKNLGAGFNLEGRTGSYAGGLSYNRSLVNLNPYIEYSWDQWQINAGFTVSADQSAESTRTGFFPNLKAKYGISETWTLKGQVSGGINWNDLNGLLNDNNFLDDSLLMQNTVNQFEIGGGIEGKPHDKVKLEASITYSVLDDLPFYVPSESNLSRYTITYDAESVNLLSIRSGLSFFPSSKSMVGGSLTLNEYNTESQLKPWHLPSFIFSAFAQHNFKEKLLATVRLTSMSGIRAPLNDMTQFTRVSGFTDVGLDLKYLITDRISAFIEVNNLLNDEYERYLGYPTRGLAFKLGGQYRF